MIDHAIVRQREGHYPSAMIREACLIRFRPIMMTTAVALASAVTAPSLHLDVLFITAGTWARLLDTTIGGLRRAHYDGR